MFNSKCRRIQADFLAYLDGALPEDQSLSAHLASCERCRRAFARVKQSDALLQGVFAEVNRARIPESFWDGLDARLAGQETTQTVITLARSPGRRRWRTWASIGGGVGLIVLGFLWHTIHQPELYREQQELEQIRQSILRMEAEMAHFEKG